MSPRQFPFRSPCSPVWGESGFRRKGPFFGGFHLSVYAVSQAGDVLIDLKLLMQSYLRVIQYGSKLLHDEVLPPSERAPYVPPPLRLVSWYPSSLTVKATTTIKTTREGFRYGNHSGTNRPDYRRSSYFRRVRTDNPVERLSWLRWVNRPGFSGDSFS